MQIIPSSSRKTLVMGEVPKTQRHRRIEIPDREGVRPDQLGEAVSFTTVTTFHRP